MWRGEFRWYACLIGISSRDRMLVIISPPKLSPKEAIEYNRLFSLGLHGFILRIPGASVEEYKNALLAIDPAYRERVLIDDHFELLQQIPLGGAYLNARKRDCYREVQRYTSRIATSAHSIEELENLPFVPVFALLSPVFDSISKKGYRASIDLQRCKDELPQLSFPVVALGGITPERQREVLSHGFSGVAVLGYIYTRIGSIEKAFLGFEPPRVLSIAGHDPSGGAGFSADTLTITSLQAYPLTIASALTEQSEIHFAENTPLPLEKIGSALKLLQISHSIRVAKIGLTSSLEQARGIADLLRARHIPNVIWDPVVTPSRGEKLLLKPDFELLRAIASKISLITPNEAEAEILFGKAEPAFLSLQAKDLGCAILLTGRKNKMGVVEDCLYLPSGASHSFTIPATPYEKHGTGCALSAAIATYLAHGYSLFQACIFGQRYVDEMRRSSSTLVRDFRYSMQRDKKNRLQHARLQYITNSSDPEEILFRSTCFLEAGGRWIQLRMKNTPHKERLATARKLHTLCQRYDATLIINDDLDAVLESDADGVHLGIDDCPIAEARKRIGINKIIGGTCNNADDIRRRALEGADYIGVGPYRHTTTKENLSPLLGQEGIFRLIQEAKALPYSMPFIAIGGITAEDIPILLETGADGIAISGAIDRSKDIVGTTRQILDIISERKVNSPE